MLLIGGIGVVDLRVLGAWRRLPLAPLSAALTPLALAGLALFAVSGVAMALADVRALAASPVFPVKLLLIALALLNAVAFRRFARGRLAAWEFGAPATARVFAASSLALWLAVMVAGRMIAYV